MYYEGTGIGVEPSDKNINNTEKTMLSKISFSLRQKMKSFLQNVILPAAYFFFKAIYRKKPELIVFADAHHKDIPYSMQRIHSELEKKGCKITDVFEDYSSMSFIGSSLSAVRFMKTYARARVVFICDNFLPVASCKKRKETTVVQLWHSCGLLKKMGYDTTEDIPAGYKGNVYRNYDLLTVSAPALEEVFARATKLDRSVVRALGVSRSDIFFDEKWHKDCISDFHKKYPEAKGKKVILWAPTFRGNAHNPYFVGTDGIKKLRERLGEEYYLITKAHPHMEAKYSLSSCPIPTERLLPVTDLLITDYSSVFFDFLFFGGPTVLFAPDLEEYEKKRGFYVDYGSLCSHIVTDEEKLSEAVLTAINGNDASRTERLKAYHISSCDGCSTERIIKAAGL